LKLKTRAALMELLTESLRKAKTFALTRKRANDLDPIVEILRESPAERP